MLSEQRLTTFLYHRNKRVLFGSRSILPFKFVTKSNFSFSFINSIFFLPGIHQLPSCLTSTLVTANWPAESLWIFLQVRKIYSVLQYYCFNELLFTPSDQTEHKSRFYFGTFYSAPLLRCHNLIRTQRNCKEIRWNSLIVMQFISAIYLSALITFLDLFLLYSIC